MAESEAAPERRRRRPAMRRKIRCNRETPCNNCVRSKNEQCIYEIHPSQPPRQPPRQHLGQSNPVKAALAQLPRQLHLIAPVDTASNSSASSASAVSGHLPGSSGPSSTSASSPAGPTLTQDVESMRSRIRQLEDALAKSTIQSIYPSPLTPASSSSVETATSRLAGTFHLHHSTMFGQARISSRSIMHKTRMFGQSHWINGISMYLDMFREIEPFVLEDTSRAMAGIKRCKSLGKLIKLRRAPLWPSPPTPDLPSKDVADKLVECYLRTSESVYRVVHIPTLMRNYEALWMPNAKSDPAFLVLLKLVFAIGATTYDSQFSLRTDAIRWVYEAQTWNSAPEFKSRLSMQSLQINILLILARETAGVGRDLVWVAAGALFRTAMYMGLHRDPAHLSSRTKFTAEMRRRLWNVILEIGLQSSMSSGGAPLISLDDFDAEPPGNFDDDQLLDEDAIPKPDDQFTQVSILRALCSTFPIRLAVAKFLNNLNSNSTYEETLRLDAELRTSYKDLCRTLKKFESTTGESPSQFSMRLVDFIMRHYLSSVHVPFFERALHETAYAYSRKVVIDASLNIWCAVYPASSLNGAASSEEDDFARLVACGGTHCRTIAMQGALLIGVEVKSQLQEEESLGPVRLRPSLLPVVEEAKAWCWRCIEAGETNIKGYLVLCMLSAQVDGLLRGLYRSEFPKILIEAVEKAEENASLILEEKAALGEPEEAAYGLTQMSLDTTPELIEGWDFMMADTELNFSSMDPASWMLNDGVTQEAPIW
ncbi:hypothetical protein G7Z17_g1240 [Cylindrodendrum hubeiense]|uniref:Xylanolytic transcriptional activator regulatory domain-containing protein n=1 Tax=Cylindrodendrum hubeiense TaxID=595255 RepID=A0A9P5HGC8_9HYPO|nr:hypothetical protein G7Z17_g1240 [Cylindrodendrum hubeiense]